METLFNPDQVYGHHPPLVSCVTGKSSDLFVLFLLTCKIATAVIPASVGYCDVFSRMAGTPSEL